MTSVVGESSRREPAGIRDASGVDPDLRNAVFRSGGPEVDSRTPRALKRSSRLEVILAPAVLLGPFPSRRNGLRPILPGPPLKGPKQIERQLSMG